MPWPAGSTPPRARRAWRASSSAPSRSPRSCVERFGTASRPAREAILEVLLRRFYRIRALDEIRVDAVDGHPFAVASYEREGRRRHALLTHAGDASLSAALARMGRLAAPAPPDRELVGDVFLWRPEGPGDAEANAAEFREVLDGVAAAAPVPADRGRGGRAGRACSTSPSARPPAGGYAEEAFFRDAHPMMAKRLQLHRLQHFDLERLPVGRGRLRLPGGREGEPAGRAALRGGRGPGPHAGSRRRGPRGAAARARADAPRDPRRHTPGPGAAARRPAPPRQPRHPARLAGPRRLRRGPRTTSWPGTPRPPRASASRA